MMGPAKQIDGKLFYYGFSLEERVRQDNPLRAVQAQIDFSFVRTRVQDLYGTRGNESIDPTVLMKLMFLLFLENVPSERALMDRMPERLDWLWFCGYDLDETVPDHSVLSKARRLWGHEVFKEFFARILGQCIEAGLVDGSLVHVDSSLENANASKDHLHAQLRLTGEQLYQDLEDAEGLACGEVPPPTPEAPASTPSSMPDAACGQEPLPPLATRISDTDPDARLETKNGKTVLGYKDHRVVDDRCGVITATHTTSAAVRDPHMLGELLREHQFNTGRPAQTVAADKAYGTKENYRDLRQEGVTPCIPHAAASHVKGKFPREKFRYDPQRDVYICPSGQVLAHRSGRAGGEHRYWAAEEVCQACPLRDRCTDACPRHICRHEDEQHVEWADHCLSRGRRQMLMRRRKIRAEGSFADAANNHGYKRARWRGLMKVSIQNLMIAAIQNIRKLLRTGSGGSKTARQAPFGALVVALGTVWEAMAIFWTLSGVFQSPIGISAPILAEGTI